MIVVFTIVTCKNNNQTEHRNESVNYLASRIFVWQYYPQMGKRTDKNRKKYGNKSANHAERKRVFQQNNYGSL
jgi:hypothetical protein